MLKKTSTCICTHKVHTYFVVNRNKQFTLHISLLHTYSKYTSLSLFFSSLSFYVELTVAPPHGNMELFAAGIQAPCAPLTVV